MEELINEESKIELVVLFGESDNNEKVLFRMLVCDYIDSWITIGGRVENRFFVRPALTWILHGLAAALGRVPSVAVVGGVLEDNVLLAANEAAKAFPELTSTVLTPLCLTEADYAVHAPDAVAMMTADDDDLGGEYGDDLSDEDDYDWSDDQE